MTRWRRGPVDRYPGSIPADENQPADALVTHRDDKSAVRNGTQSTAGQTLGMTETTYAESLPDVVTTWARWQRTTCGPSTIRQRADIVERLREHVAHERRVIECDPRSITTEEISAYLAQEHLGGNARATYFRALACWFGWLHQSGRLAVDPTLEIRSPKTPDDDPNPLTIDEVRRVFEGLDHPPLRAMMMLALLAGLRCHEVAKFRGDDIRDDTLRVRGKGGRVCTVPLDPQLAELARIMPAGEWFPSPLRSREHVRVEYVSRVVADRFREVGIMHGSIHRLRHTYGTLLQEHVGDTRVVQELMRHRSITSTQRYTRVSGKRLRSAMNGLPQLSA